MSAFLEAMQKAQLQKALQPQAVALAKLLAAKGQQATPEAQAAVGLMMNPNSRAAGIDLAGGLLNQLSAQADPAYQARLQGQTLQNVAQAQGITAFPQEQARAQAAEGRAAAAEGRAAEIFPIQKRTAQANLQGQLLQNQQAQRLLAEAAKPVPALPYGEAPKGTYPAMGPRGIEYIPQPGTAADSKAQADMRDAEQSVRLIQQFLETVDRAGPSGTDLFGANANALAFQRGNVLSQVAKVRGLGVIQPAEMELLDAQLPDPTGFIRNFLSLQAATADPTGSLSGLMRDSILEPYQILLEEQQTRLRELREKYWYVAPVPVLPEDAR